MGSRVRLGYLGLACAVACGSWLLPRSWAAPSHAVATLTHRDRLYDIAAVAGQAWIVGHPGLLLRAEEGGSRFAKVPLSTREALFAVGLAPDGKSAVVVGRSCTVLRSGDLTGPFEDISAAASLACEGAALFDVALLRDGTVVAVGDVGTILVSRDRGRTWRRGTFDAALGAAAQDESEGVIDEARLSSVAFWDTSSGVIVGEFGLILHTRDGGQSWQRIDGGTDKQLFAVTAWGAARAVAVGAEGTILETRDAGMTWSVVKAPTTAGLFGVSRAQAGLWIVGAGGVALTRADADERIELRATGIFTWLQAAACFDRESCILVGGRGHVLRTADAGARFERLLGE